VERYCEGARGEEESLGSGGLAEWKKGAGEWTELTGGGGTRTYIPTRVSNPIDLAVDAAKTSSNRGRVGGQRVGGSEARRMRRGGVGGGRVGGG